MEIKIREALSAQGTPIGEFGEDMFYARVGLDWSEARGTSFAKVGKVSRITVTNDLPGLHCNMERVRVFVSDSIVWEGPLHSLEGVSYPSPKKTT